MNNNKQEDIESRILVAARELFTEKGYSDTSMSDIAARVGINRPVLHYYFRTKERMFNAVFGSIVGSLLPKIQDILKNEELSVEERISMVVDTYYNILKANPSLPMFIMREVNRDYNFIESFIKTMNFDKYFFSIREYIQQYMNEGVIKKTPMRFVFLMFYSQLIMPFTLKPICEHVMLNEDESFEEMLDKWKPYIVRNITKALAVDDSVKA